MRIGKVLLSLEVLERLLHLDGAHIYGVEYDSVERIVTLGFESPDFPEVLPGYPVRVCHLTEKQRDLIVIHPDIVRPEDLEK